MKKNIKIKNLPVYIDQLLTMCKIGQLPENFIKTFFLYLAGRRYITIADIEKFTVKMDNFIQLREEARDLFLRRIEEKKQLIVTYEEQIYLAKEANDLITSKILDCMDEKGEPKSQKGFIEELEYLSEQFEKLRTLQSIVIALKDAIENDKLEILLFEWHSVKRSNFISDLKLLKENIIEKMKKRLPEIEGGTLTDNEKFKFNMSRRVKRKQNLRSLSYYLDLFLKVGETGYLPESLIGEFWEYLHRNESITMANIKKFTVKMDNLIQLREEAMDLFLRCLEEIKKNTLYLEEFNNNAIQDAAENFTRVQTIFQNKNRSVAENQQLGKLAEKSRHLNRVRKELDDTREKAAQRQLHFYKNVEEQYYAKSDLGLHKKELLEKMEQRLQEIKEGNLTDNKSLKKMRKSVTKSKTTLSAHTQRVIRKIEAGHLKKWKITDFYVDFADRSYITMADVEEFTVVMDYYLKKREKDIDFVLRRVEGMKKNILDMEESRNLAIQAVQNVHSIRIALYEKKNISAEENRQLDELYTKFTAQDLAIKKLESAIKDTKELRVSFEKGLANRRDFMCGLRIIEEDIREAMKKRIDEGTLTNNKKLT